MTQSKAEETTTRGAKMKKTRMMVMAMLATGLTVCPPAVVDNGSGDVAKQRINSTEQAKQRINVAPKGVELAKQRINATDSKG